MEQFVYTTLKQILLVLTQVMEKQKQFLNLQVDKGTLIDSLE